MKIIHTPLPGLCLLESPVHEDHRGRFERAYCEQAMSGLAPQRHIAQANLSTTIGLGSLRGLHYQSSPALEAKLVRCLAGRVFDVAVDLRSGSPTFLQWHGVELSEDVPRALYIPEGFAHGFQVLSDRAQLLYLHTAAWNAECEGGLRHDDPALGIRWPLPVGTISERDLRHPLLDAAFTGVST
jgi:dTDP-4-dehydrorhamnose 3,5-epimerase